MKIKVHHNKQFLNILKILAKKNHDFHLKKSKKIPLNKSPPSHAILHDITLIFLTKLNLIESHIMKCMHIKQNKKIYYSL